jgi:conjugal transfer pilus assembly protein TraE
MKFKDAMRNMRELQLMTKGLLLSNIILGAGFLWSLATISGERERIVLVPPMLDAKAEVAWNSANKEYIKGFGMYIATLVGNIQPKSSTVVLDAVSAFMDPQIYTEFRRQLLTLIEDPVFKASGSVITFQPNSIQYEPETNRVFVTGTLITATSGSQKYQKQVTYEMGITIREGRPWVSHFLSYEGTIPRTVSWHVNRSSRDGVEIPEYATPARYRKKQSAADKANEQLLDLDGMKPVGTPIPEGTGAVQEVVEGVSKPVKETESKEQN